MFVFETNCIGSSPILATKMEVPSRLRLGVLKTLKCREACASWTLATSANNMEDCQSGLLCFFAKEVGVTAPQVRILYPPLVGQGEV